MIKRYSQFLNEADQVSEPIGIKSLDKSKYSTLIEIVTKMINETIKNSSEFDSFIKSFKKNQKDNEVEGFINDSDIYEFYLKYRNDIEEILNKVKFYDKSPTEVDALGLYEYVIEGTKRAFLEIVNMIEK